MPQKPLDASDSSVRLTLRLTKRQTLALDEKRGKISRSAYVRSAIDRALFPDDLAPRLMVTTAEEVMEEKKIRVIPTNEHRHVYANKSELPIRSQMRGRLQMQVYAYTCECGDVREGI